MSRLFKLREWLTLNEAADHISNLLGEPVKKSELYRLAIEGHLTLSVDFVNHADARKGKWVKTEQVEFVLREYDVLTGEKLDVPFELPKNHEIRVSQDDWIALEKPVVSIGGVWDLTMAGGERLDIEHKYQHLTSGLKVTLETIEGAFVQKCDVVCQLQESFDDNEFQKGSKAYGEKLESEFRSDWDISGEEKDKLRAKYKEDRDKYLEEKRNKPKEDDYNPAGGLHEESTLVIRTSEVTRFIQSLQDTPVQEKPLSSKERNSLLVLIGALCNEVGIEPDERGVATALVHMTESLGAPLTDDTVRKILKQVKDAVELRSK